LRIAVAVHTPAARLRAKGNDALKANLVLSPANGTDRSKPAVLLSKPRAAIFHALIKVAAEVGSTPARVHLHDCTLTIMEMTMRQMREIPDFQPGGPVP
jgi:hypothetical protein